MNTPNSPAPRHHNFNHHSSAILAGLNPAQSAAVTALDLTTLVIAGAGSGKTRVLTHRIAWLLMEQNISANNIMAVTFTNKAAAEMRHRLERMLGANLGGMWLGTFHGLAHRFLRLHWHEANLDQNFQIIDADDQLRLLRRIHKELNLDEEKWLPKESQVYINKNKEMCLRPQHIKPTSGIEATMLKIYQTYTDNCGRGNLVDFAELLLRMHEVLQEQVDLLATYRQRFSHILVDEFQDTNSLQYLWIRALALNNSNLMAVGDDDQSIYGWRGANVENIQHLINDFSNTKIIRLEQNYRSTSTILKAANAVIANNEKRLGKNLWTEGNDGELITLYTAYNEIDEAQYVIGKIKEIAHAISDIPVSSNCDANTNVNADASNDNCRKLSDVAILYRSNAQSRLFEEQLISTQIPYRIYGGLRFFERAEIKDALAYLRTIINPADDAAFERIINVPTRGIGETTLLQIRDHARQQQMPLFSAIQDMLSKKMLATRAMTALNSFVELIQNLRQQLHQLEFGELVAYTIKASGLYDYFAKDKNERNLMRVDNLEELHNAARQFALDKGAKNDNAENSFNCSDLLTAFLANAALEAGETEQQAVNAASCVQLMTLHAAKGLEFHTVFLCGMEDGLFPHSMSMMTPHQLEEERRLCYVGITRAQRKLYCTHAESRRMHGTTTRRLSSRFLREIPPELIAEDDDSTSMASGYHSERDADASHKNHGNSNNHNGSRNNGGRYSSESNYKYRNSNAEGIKNKNRNLYSHIYLGAGVKSSATNLNTSACGTHDGLKIGQRIKHQKFGEGTVISFEGQDEHLLVQIKFARAGVKWLSPAYAKLEKM